ncbi:hypothetical protein MAPG_08906 [Magnaporthiopsis poae ATCC 64411]|uniref:Uncharacterized protein n=1 Tax=Magnaporthiopsis poae (strain ATCC 64411 / 73-15) TaxID=644358 RepID=A0A0C4E8J7_MAGP6|nr:hypothetical protein MAPG_08906 [Magnaporthiopsis poae ATCC 64411]
MVRDLCRFSALARPAGVKPASCALIYCIRTLERPTWRLPDGPLQGPTDRNARAMCRLDQPQPPPIMDPARISRIPVSMHVGIQVATDTITLSLITPTRRQQPQPLAKPPNHGPTRLRTSTKQPITSVFGLAWPASARNPQPLCGPHPPALDMRPSPAEHRELQRTR